MSTAAAQAALALPVTVALEVAADGGALWGSPRMVAAGLALLAAGGSFALYALWHECLRLWANDPLRSIGAAFPLIAFAGVVAAWRRLGWARQGSWWGLALIAMTLPLARLVDLATVMLTFDGHRFGLVHPGPVLFLYGVGAVLLFGGKALLRASVAPLCLLLLVNPVPYVYNTAVDLPLQTLSADTARGFAHLIDLQPTGEELRMMFAPDFGMLIVPGCNGVRGSITFAYLALIFGYTRRLRPGTLGLVTVGAFLTGYALNLLRLCVLVIYYRAGLGWPSIQEYGVGVDYAIGCSIFVVATLGLGLLIRWLERPAPPSGAALAPIRTRVTAKAVCLAALTLVFIVPQARSLGTAEPLRADEAAVLQSLPQKVGEFRLARRYSEHDSDGHIALGLGDYVGPPAADGSVPRLTLGLWVASGNHMVALSRLMQGAHALDSGAFDAATEHGTGVHFATSFYDDGVTREYDADAQCSASGCSDHVLASGRSPLVVDAPALRDLFVVSSGKRLPIYLERSSPDSDPSPASALRERFESDARQFVLHLDISNLVDRVGTRP